MADRYLIETSATDGYLLESGSGVLLLEQQVGAVVYDDSDSWWSNANLMAIPLGFAVAGLAASVAAAGSVSRHNDEIVPYRGAETQPYTDPYGRRDKQDTRLLFRWQNDDLPLQAVAPAVPEEDLRPSLFVLPLEVNGIIWATDGGAAIPAAVPEEDYWKAPTPQPREFKSASFAEDEIPSTVVQTPFEEDSRLDPVRKIADPVRLALQPDEDVPTVPFLEEEYRLNLFSVVDSPYKLVFYPEDEITTAQATTLVEEDYSLSFQVKVDQPYRYWQSADDEVVPVVVTEEGEWRAPGKVQMDPQFASIVGTDEQIVPQPAPLGTDEMYDLKFFYDPAIYKLSRMVWVEDDVPVLSIPAGPTNVEWLVRARRRGIR